MTPLSATPAGVRLGYDYVFGKPCTWDGVVARLRRYSLVEVLDYLGRVSAVVFDAGHRDLKAQQKLSVALLGERAEYTWAAARRLDAENRARRGRSPLVVLFDDPPVATAVKLALLNLRPDGPMTEAPLDALGEALLMLNELVDRTERTPTGMPMDTEEGLGAWAYYVYSIGTFQTTDNHLRALARAHDLYLTDKAYLRDRPDCAPDYVNLPELVGRATGLAPDTLWGILFAFLAHFYTITADNAHETRAAISRSRYFEHFDFTADEIDRFFALVARPAMEVAAEVAVRYSVQDPKPYDVLPLERSPLIVIGDEAFCPMVRLLLEKMTTGFYHVLLNAFPTGTPEGLRRRDRFQRYLGAVFEDYVDRLFRRAHEDAARRGASPPMYFGPDALRRAVTGKKGAMPPICDGLLVQGDTAVLIESKARFLPADARSGVNKDAFLDRFGENCEKSARQLDATVGHICSGALEPLGVGRDQVAHFFPVMVSLPDLPIQPPLFRWVVDRVRRKGLLTGARVRPMEIVHVGLLEGLETLMAEGLSLGDVLGRKAANSGWWDQSLNNFVVHGGVPAYGNAQNAYLAARYNELADRAEHFLRSRGGGGIDDEEAAGD